MLLTILLFLAGVGGREVLVFMVLMLLLIVAGIWRLLRPSKPAVVVQQHVTPTSIADELQKLQQLHEQGVLTQQEFEDQKRRLLTL